LNSRKATLSKKRERHSPPLEVEKTIYHPRVPEGGEILGEEKRREGIRSLTSVIRSRVNVPGFLRERREERGAPGGKERVSLE